MYCNPAAGRNTSLANIHFFVALMGTQADAHVLDLVFMQILNVNKLNKSSATVTNFSTHKHSTHTTRQVCLTHWQMFACSYCKLYFIFLESLETLYLYFGFI